MHSLKVDASGYAPARSTRHPGHRAASHVDNHEASSQPVSPSQSSGVQAETMDVTVGWQNAQEDGPVLEQKWDMEVRNGPAKQAPQRELCQKRHTLSAGAS